MRHIPHLQVFLASPGDVSTERDIVNEVAADLNRSVAKSLGFIIDVIRWETHSFPEFGSDGQDILNKQIAVMSDMDLFVGILWNRFGTPTPRAESGTVEEFNAAVAYFRQSGSPHIMMYFRTQTDPETENVNDQQQKVRTFKASIQGQSLYWDYASPDAFRTLIYDHMVQWLLRRSREDHQEPKLGAQYPVEKSIDWMLLGQRFFSVESSNETQTTIEIQISPSSSDEDEAIRSLAKTKGPFPYAFHLSAYDVTIEKSNRESSQGKTIWNLLLKKSEKSDSIFSEVTFNSHSPLDIATMKARLILLDEAPPKGQYDLLSGYIRRTSLEGHEIPDHLLAKMWAILGKDPKTFLPQAKLIAVYYLKSFNVVDQIQTLELGPITDAGMKVSFKGYRPKVYINKEPDAIEVFGMCPLP